MVKRTPELLQAALKKVEEQIAASPSSSEAYFTKAYLLESLGRLGDAKEAYLKVLSLDPNHIGALLNLGILAEEMGFRSAAQNLYTQAITKHPNNPKGHINLAHIFADKTEALEARKHYEMALNLAPDLMEACSGLMFAVTELGDVEALEAARKRIVKSGAVSILPYRGTKAPVDLLILASSTGGNTPLRKFLDNRIFKIAFLNVEFYDQKVPLPYKLVFNAIGDADRPGCKEALDDATELIKRMPDAVVINHPKNIYDTGRISNSKRLKGIPGVVAPLVEAVSCEELKKPDAPALLAERGFSFPLLLRKPGYHTGKNFIKVDSSAELPKAVAELACPGLLVIEFLNACGADGSARKYRVMMVDGELFPLHLAISQNWKVHYFSADMGTSAEHRVEEERFLNDMPSVLGEPAMRALSEIQKTLGLDYAGIDFGLNANGEVLLFETNATMIIVYPDAKEQWNYRREPIRKIFDAVTAMIQKRWSSIRA